MRDVYADVFTATYCTLHYSFTYLLISILPLLM